MSHKDIVKEYFQSWIDKDSAIINLYFDENIQYTECYGPVYKNKNQVSAWFSEWNKKGTVLSWDIREEYELEQVVIVVWNFCCEYEKKISDFDGVSIVEFTENNKISSIREYESKSTHIFPYEGNLTMKKSEYRT